jgi:hypothetical protein
MSPRSANNGTMTLYVPVGPPAPETLEKLQNWAEKVSTILGCAVEFHFNSAFRGGFSLKTPNNNHLVSEQSSKRIADAIEQVGPPPWRFSR